MRALALDMPVFVGALDETSILDRGTAHTYRQPPRQAGTHSGGRTTAASAPTTPLNLKHECEMFRAGGAEAGSHDDIANQINHLHQLLGHDGQIVQMDVGKPG